jgi:hypothetical protein
MKITKSVPVIYTFIGQFIDHDMTFNKTDNYTDEAGNVNSRIPYLDLDSVYGYGPIKSPELYNEYGTHLLWDKANNDIQRDAEGVAIIADPRNDENLIITNLQLLFIRFHNKIVNIILKKYKCKKTAFKKARQSVIQYYQGMVVQDFLHKIVSSCIIKDISNNPNMYYKPGKEMWFPHEFSIGAFRYGHATVLENYKINKDETLSLGDMFVQRKNKVDWKYLTYINNCVEPQYTKKIAPFITPSLTNIPGSAPAPLTQNSIAIRNLFRAKQFELTSGQRCAEHMGYGYNHVCLDKYPFLKKIGLDKHTPIWYYILAEADVNENGKRLGIVGGRLVAEVILEAIKRSPYSFFNKKHYCLKKLGCYKKASIKKIIQFVEGGSRCY